MAKKSMINRELKREKMVGNAVLDMGIRVESRPVSSIQSSQNFAWMSF